MRDGDTSWSAGASGLEDADLVDYLHDELSPLRREDVQQQIDASPEAAARLRQLERREERLRTLLPQIDPDELSVRRSARAVTDMIAASRADRRSARRRRVLAAAGIVAVLGAAALTVEPVRAALADGVRSVARALGLETESAVTPAGDPDPAGALVRTTVPLDGAVFIVELPAAGGVIEAMTADVARATVSHSPDVPIVVTPTGVRIAAAGATVSIVLPAGTALRVVHDGRATDHPLSAEPVRIER